MLYDIKILRVYNTEWNKRVNHGKMSFYIFKGLVYRKWFIYLFFIQAEQIYIYTNIA